VNDPRGRHTSRDPLPPFGVPTSEIPAHGIPGYGVPRYEPARYDPPSWSTDLPAPPLAGPDAATGAIRRASGVMDRSYDQTGPLVEPEWWSYGSSDDPHYPLAARHSGPDADDVYDDEYTDEYSDGGTGQEHPSAPLPPRPPGVWDRLHPRSDGHDDTETVAHPAVGSGRVDSTRRHDQTSRSVGVHRADDDSTDAHPVDTGAADHAWEDRTGGLEVIGAHVEEDAPGRRGRRARREREQALHESGLRTGRPRHGDPDDDSLVHDEAFGEDIKVLPYDRRTGRGRRKRSPLAVLLSLLVLGGLVVGIVVGGGKLLTLINPASRDYTGEGTGTVQVRVKDGDTLSDIAGTLVQADVIASARPFVTAAEANKDSVGIQPGLYAMHSHMSGRAALALLLDPKTELLSRVTLPEGLTVQKTLAKLAQQTGRPLADLQAAATNTAALGLPPYANGSLEGFLFPSTYDIQPDTSSTDVLRQMVARGVTAMDDLQIPPDQRLRVLTEASIVQAEAGSVEDMGKIATVLNNRLAAGMPLQLDTTVNYANGKSGITTTSKDRQNPSPYNTYLHPGLTPGPISNPGEEAMRAVLNPTPGPWLYFVVVDPHTGETRFATTGAEHQQNVQVFQQWLRDHPNG
jgi:uncharacterized YceG family protein